MRKIVLVVLFSICCVPEIDAQPRKANSQPQRQQAQPEPTANPRDEELRKVDQAIQAERERERKEREAKDETFKENQARQNRIVTNATVVMAVAAVLNLLVAIVYALYARYTLLAVEKQANHAGEQVDKMRAQLRTAHSQSIATLAQARFTKEMLNQTRTLVIQNADMVKNMQGQLEAANVSANASVKALDENREAAKNAERISIYAQRAYVVAKIRGKSKESDRLQFRLRIVNTGNTPANEVWVHYSHGLLTEPPHKETSQKWIGTNKNIVVYDLGFEESERIGLIAPLSSYHVIETAKKGPLTSNEAQQWKLGKLKYYCWGRIEYDTIFDDDRFSEFCFYQSFDKPDGYQCKYGNEAI